MSRITKPSSTTLLVAISLLYASPAVAVADPPQPDTAVVASGASRGAEARSPAIAPFFERYFETYNSDFQYYFVRKHMRLNELTASISVNQLDGDAWETQAKAFLPIYDGERVSFLFPIYFYRFALASEQRQALPFDAIQNCFWQAIVNVDLAERFRLALITESRHVGTRESQFSLVGSDIGEFVLLEWRVSDELTIAPAIRGQVRWDSEEDAIYAITPGGHVIWRPTPSLSLSVGVPSLFSLEWAAPARIDVATHVMLGEGDIDVMAAVRKRFSHFGLTLRGLRDGYRDVFVPSFMVDVDGTQRRANLVGQYKDRVQLELELYPAAHTTVQVKAGYAHDEGVTIKLEDETVRELSGVGGFYAGLTLITHLDLER